MIQQQTILKVSDNSGAKYAKCIKVINGFNKKVCFLGDIIVVSIHQLRNKSKNVSKVKKGETYNAVIIRTKSKLIQKDGSTLSFKENCVCLISKQNKPIGTRIFGPVSRILKKTHNAKLVSISAGLL